MATTALNRIVREVNPSSYFESALPLIDATVSFNQGDLLYLDTSGHLIKAVTSDSNGATFLGISRATIVSGKLVSPYQGTAVDAAQAISDIAGPQFGVVAKMKLKSGDTFNPGIAVYACSVDAQTVSSTGSNIIGYFQDAQVTAGSSSQGNCYLVPGASMQF